MPPRSVNPKTSSKHICQPLWSLRRVFQGSTTLPAMSTLQTSSTASPAIIRKRPAAVLDPTFVLRPNLFGEPPMETPAYSEVPPKKTSSFQGNPSLLWRWRYLPTGTPSFLEGTSQGDFKHPRKPKPSLEMEVPSHGNPISFLEGTSQGDSEFKFPSYSEERTGQP